MPNWLRFILRRNPRPASLLREDAPVTRAPRPVPVLAPLIAATLAVGVVVSVTEQRPAAADTRALLRAASVEGALAPTALPALPPAGDYPDAVLPAQPSRGGPVASRSAPRAPLHRWVLPYHGTYTSGFGYRWGRLHAGIDLAGPYGAPIVAATDGCITYAGPMSGYGEVMQIHDWDGTDTVYGHMSAFVRTSGGVQAGDLIARGGAAGDATGPHLHFEVHVGSVPIDPVPVLAARGIAV